MRLILASLFAWLALLCLLLAPTAEATVPTAVIRQVYAESQALHAPLGQRGKAQRAYGRVGRDRLLAVVTAADGSRSAWRDATAEGPCPITADGGSVSASPVRVAPMASDGAWALLVVAAGVGQSEASRAWSLKDGGVATAGSPNSQSLMVSATR
jgi:hypothetical protein